MVGAFEVPGIITRPQTLASGFARLATFRLAAITLRLGITIVREEELFATPAQPFSDALHDPVPPGQECNIRNRQGRRGLNAGRRLKNHGIFSDYEEKQEAEEKAFSRRHSGGTFRPPVTVSAWYTTMTGFDIACAPAPRKKAPPGFPGGAFPLTSLRRPTLPHSYPCRIHLRLA